MINTVVNRVAALTYMPTVGLAIAALIFTSGCDNPSLSRNSLEPTVVDSADESERRDEPENAIEQSDEELSAKMNPLQYRNAILTKMKAGDYSAAERIAAEATQRQSEVTPLHLLRADSAFMNLDIEGAIEAYDDIIKIQPEQKPYLWQRGLALYYAKRFETGVEQFESHGTVNATDVENSIWHMLCASQVDGFESARANIIPVRGDTRAWSGTVYGLYAGTVAPAELDNAAPADGASPRELTNRYYTNLYLGLYYEISGEPKKSLAAMRLAAECNPYDGNVLMGQIARIHLALKDKQRQIGGHFKTHCREVKAPAETAFSRHFVSAGASTSRF